MQGEEGEGECHGKKIFATRKQEGGEGKGRRTERRPAYCGSSAKKGPFFGWEEIRENPLKKRERKIFLGRASIK